MKKLHDFNQCFPTGINPDYYQNNESKGVHFVVYAANNGKESDADHFAHLNSASYQYLVTAELILDQCYKEQISSMHDRYALPILNLYSNVIEFKLKYLILFLVFHSNACNFNVFRKPINPKIFYSHNLKLMTQYLNEFFPKKGIHVFQDFNSITNFINKWYDYGLDSIATRYLLCSSSSGRLHKKPFFINFLLVRDNIRLIYNIIDDYCQNSDFHCCYEKKYTKERLVEVEKAKNLLLNLHTSFDQYILDIQKENESKPQIREISLEELLITDPITTRFNRILSQLSFEDLCYLNMAIDFRFGISDSNWLVHYKIHDYDYIFNNVLSGAYMYKKALYSLDLFLKRANKILRMYPE